MGSPRVGPPRVPRPPLALAAGRHELRLLGSGGSLDDAVLRPPSVPTRRATRRDRARRRGRRASAPSSASSCARCRVRVEAHPRRRARRALPRVGDDILVPAAGRGAWRRQVRDRRASRPWSPGPAPGSAARRSRSTRNSRVGDAPLSQSHSLRVPECRRGIDAPCGQSGDRVEPDRHALDCGRVGAVGLEHGVEHRVVGRQAGDPDGPALQVSRPPDFVAVARDDRRERAWTIGATPTMSSPRSRAMPRSLMSMIANSVRPASSSFGRVRRRAGLADLEVDALVRVVALRLRGVDAGVHGVRNEVEHKGRLLRGARFSTVAAAGREADRERRRPPATLRPLTCAAAG